VGTIPSPPLCACRGIWDDLYIKMVSKLQHKIVEQKIYLENNFCAHTTSLPTKNNLQKYLT
jgi:hypothetical protein